MNVSQVHQVLASVSDVLFPESLGDRIVSIDSRGTGGDTPLHVVVWRNDLEGAKVLIEAGADVNAIGEMGETPLHVALRLGLAPLGEELIRAGARQDIRSEFGMTAAEITGLGNRADQPTKE